MINMTRYRFCMLALLFFLFISTTVSNATTTKSSQTNNQYLEAQRLLANWGFYGDNVDGMWGKRSESALLNFQSWANIPITGVLDDTTWQKLKQSVTPPQQYVACYKMQASAYSPEETSGITARGHFVRHGLVSVDPSHIPFGSRLYISGYGYAVADDCGGAMSSQLLDLGFDTLADAIAFGYRDVEVFVLQK